MTNDQKMDQAVRLVRSHVPIVTKFKSASWSQKLIGRVFRLFGNKTYTDSFWTTIGSTVYRPLMAENGATDEEWVTVLHEGRHILDGQSRWFQFLYLFPQILFLPLLVAILAVWWLLGWKYGLPALGVGLLALLPLPAYWRARYELRAYKVSTACYIWACGGLLKEVRDQISEWLAGVFKGPSYYYMWPFQKSVRKSLDTWMESVQKDEAVLDLYLKDCRELSRTMGPV